MFLRLQTGHNRAFYMRVLATALPMIGQNAVTMLVSMVDNLMVGQLSDAGIAGVAIINNNLIFIFNLCLFGAAAGAGIFTTQFYGSGDYAGVRHTFRFKLYLSGLLTVLGIGVFLLWGDKLIGLYLQADGDPELASQTLHYAGRYLKIMLWGLVPFAVTNAYAGTLKVCGSPTIALVASVGATVTNLVGNWILIFGNLGAPAMGVEGAAVATVLSRYVELGILVIWTHCNTKKLPYVKGLYRSLRIPLSLLKAILRKGMILLVNEAMWAFGMAFLNQCYSVWGQDVNAALSVSSIMFNMASVVFKGLGVTVGIITGQMLGADVSKEELRSANVRMTLMSIGSGILFGGLMAALSGWFPGLYEIKDSARYIASGLILIAACDVLLQSYIFPVYFTLRAGGRTLTTFLFDCGSIWLISLPLAFILSRYSSLHVFTIYAIVTGVDVIKSAIGFFLMRSGTWMQKLTTK